jgi:hypothetical protein
MTMIVLGFSRGVENIEPLLTPVIVNKKCMRLESDLKRKGVGSRCECLTRKWTKKDCPKAAKISD